MNLNNIFKKVTGVALAGAIAFAGFAGTASAAELPEGTFNDAPVIRKTVETNADYFGGHTFEFNIEKGTVPVDSYDGWVKPEADPGLIVEGIRNIQIDSDTEDLTNTVALGVNDPAGTVQPGVYRYVVTEKNPGISGMEENTQQFNVDIFVARTAEGNGREIVRYIVTNKEGTKSNLDFLNKITTNTIEVNKVISGNQANLSDKFTFTLKFNNAATNNSIRVNGEAVPENGEVVLSHNEKFTITGISSGDQVEIVESENDGNQVKGYTTEITTTGAAERATINNETKTITAYGDAGNITFTNTKDQQIPTGLIENIAPFILAIAAAGIVFFVYFKRDKEEELA